jgi:hypothetical protein
MKKHKIISGIAVAFCLILSIAMMWQHQKIKKEIIRDFALEHGVLEVGLKDTLNEYEQSSNQVQLAQRLDIARMQVHRASDLPKISQLNGVSYAESIPYLSEIANEFDYSLFTTLVDAAESARHEQLTEQQLQELTDYHKLLKSFLDTMITKDFKEKSLNELEENLASFYSDYREK